MSPIGISPIINAATGTYAVPAGGISVKPSGADFAAQMGGDGPMAIPLTGGVQTGAAAAPLAQSIHEPTNFGHLMQQMVRDVEQTQQVAGEKVRDVLAGGPTPVHEALIATEEASVAFQMLAEVRNKVVDAYQEVMRMNV